MIHLKQVRIQIIIQHDVKSKHFKGQAVLDVVWLSTHIVLHELWFDWDDSLDDNVFNLSPHLLWVYSLLREVFSQLGERPFVLAIAFLFTRVFNKVLIFLVNGVVGEMHE